MSYPPPPGYPPPGYPPPPYGYPPPYSPGPPSLLTRTVLDQQVAESRATRPPWPALTTWGSVGLLVGLIVVINVVALTLLPKHNGGGSLQALLLTTVAEILLLGGTLALARRVAVNEGGWGRAFGLQWIKGSDWLPWITGIGIVFVARIVVSIIAYATTRGRALQQASNVHLNHVSALSIIGLALVAGVLAPITEELIFRGIVLRGLMRRMPFWPAALISSVVFGALHAYEVRTVAGAVTLAVSVGALGLTNCYLVRITGRLAPGMMVHATFNLLAVLVVALRAH